MSYAGYFSNIRKGNFCLEKQFLFILENLKSTENDIKNGSYPATQR